MTFGVEGEGGYLAGASRGRQGAVLHAGAVPPAGRVPARQVAVVPHVLHRRVGEARPGRAVRRRVELAVADALAGGGVAGAVAVAHAPALRHGARDAAVGPGVRRVARARGVRAAHAMAGAGVGGAAGALLLALRPQVAGAALARGALPTAARHQLRGGALAPRGAPAGLPAAGGARVLAGIAQEQRQLRGAEAALAQSAAGGGAVTRATAPAHLRASASRYIRCCIME